MQISTITLARTVQVRQYEPLHVTITATLAEGEDSGAAYAALLEEVRTFLWDATGHQRTDFAPRAAPGPLPFS